MLSLSEAQISQVLTYQELIPAIREALKAFSAGRVIQPIRSVLPVSHHSGWFAVMPAVYGAVMGAKMVTFYPNNANLGKHTHLAVINLFRADTGEPLASMDGRLITEMRTAAVSAVAIDQLAPVQVSRLAIIGSGVQARSHVKALSHVRQFNDVRVWSRSEENAQRFASEISAQHVRSVKDAVASADVILTLTSSTHPVLESKWLKRDALVCAIGAVTPARRELDDDLMRGSVIVESREAALRESGDIAQTNSEITAEIGEFLNGMSFVRKPGPMIFKSVGIAVEDIATASLVLRKAPAVSILKSVPANIAITVSRMDRRSFLYKSVSGAFAAVGTSSAGQRSKKLPPLEAAPLSLEEISISELSRQMSIGVMTSESICVEYLQRIDEVDRKGPTLRAILETNPDALAIARSLDQERKTKGARGFLHGVPILIKDNIETGDKMQTTAGSLALMGTPAARDSFVAQQLRAAGAVILGKTNLSEWANFRSTRSVSGWSGRGRSDQKSLCLGQESIRLKFWHRFGYFSKSRGCGGWV